VSRTEVPDDDWQRLWFATRQQAWSSLAIIPSDGGIDAGDVAESLAATGRLLGERPVNLINATGIQLADVHQLIESLGAMTGRGDCVIVPVDAIAENPGAIPIVRATSAAVLVVRLGESLIDSARSAIELVGRERFLGSVVLQGRGRKGRPSLRLTIPTLALVCTCLRMI
jgi:hypothetical protein